jgi:transposase-like protein
MATDETLDQCPKCKCFPVVRLKKVGTVRLKSYVCPHCYFDTPGTGEHASLEQLRKLWNDAVSYYRSYGQCTH